MMNLLFQKIENIDWYFKMIAIWSFKNFVFHRNKKPQYGIVKPMERMLVALLSKMMEI